MTPRPGRAVRRTHGWLLLFAALVPFACRDRAQDDLYPNSRILIERRYSENRWEIAGTHEDPLPAIASWYDARFAGFKQVDRSDEPAVASRRWRLPDRHVFLVIVDHGRVRSVYVQETLKERHRSNARDRRQR